MTYYQPPPHVLPLQYYFNVHISMDDYRRLGCCLSSWARLNELLILGQFTLEELKQLLLIELSLKQRQQVLIKLQSRISTAETKHVTNLINASTHAIPGKKDRTSAGQLLQAPRNLPAKVRVAKPTRSRRPHLGR